MAGKEKGTRFERQLKKMLEEKGFFVVRASGSGSDGVSPDLIALSSTLNLAIECKARNSDCIYIEKPKFDIMTQWQRITAIPVYVAWKAPRKEWRFFPLMALQETEKAMGLNIKNLETGLDLDAVTTMGKKSYC